MTDKELEYYQKTLQDKMKSPPPNPIPMTGDPKPNPGTHAGLDGIPSDIPVVDGSLCLAGDTPILLSNGSLVEIKNLKIADEVAVSYGAISGTFSERVEKVLNSSFSQWCEIEISDGEILRTSLRQPIMTACGQVPAQDLIPGAALVSHSGATQGARTSVSLDRRVSAVRILSGRITLYWFETQNIEATAFVGRFTIIGKKKR